MRIVAVDKAHIAQSLHVFVSAVIAGFGACSGYQIADTFLGIQVDGMQRFGSGDQREIPSGPGQLMLTVVAE